MFQILNAIHREIMETVKRLNPTPNTRRELFLLSRNECAFQGCHQKMIDNTGHYIGKICHIEAANIGAERFNPSQTNEERRHISNLILLCGTHHDITNDVDRFPVELMKNMKKNHENISLSNHTHLNNRDIDIFIDASLHNEAQFPKNYGLLDTTYCDDDFFTEANEIIKNIARLPLNTRSFYANALNNSYGNGLSISFDPREIEQRLGINQEIIMTHVTILQRVGLLSDLDNDEYPIKLRYHFIGQDWLDQQIHFLSLLKKFCLDKPFVLLDIIENLNFVLIDK